MAAALLSVRWLPAAETRACLYAGNDRRTAPPAARPRVGGERMVRAYSGNGNAVLERDANGTYSVEIAPSSAVLITAD